MSIGRSGVLRRSVVACLWSMAAAELTSGQEGLPPVDVGGADAYIREQMASRRLPGLAVAVVEDGRVVLSRGYGMAAAGRAVTPRTQFYVGSCTKSFTALAVMQLVARGQLGLDAPVQRYLPWFEVADRKRSAEITVRQLLNQTSGLSEAGDPAPNARHATLLASARSLAAVRPTAPPGSRFQYYNQNYRLLGALVEQVSGRPFSGYLRDHVFGPLGMSSTTADPAFATDLAQGHAWVFGFPIARSQGYDAGALSSGYVISTAEDLAQYLLALLGRGCHGKTVVAEPHTVRALFTLPSGVSPAGIAPPGIAEILGGPPVESGYAMGWLVARAPQGRRLVFHAGSLERFRADMLLLPEDGRGFAILVNENGVLQPLFEPDPLWLGLARLLVGIRPAPPPAFRLRVLLFVLLAACDVAIGLFRLARLPRWKARIVRRSPAQRWVRAFLDAAVPAAFLLGFPPVLGSLARAEVTWLGFLDFIPDLAAWLLASASLSLLRGLAKVALLIRA